MKYLKAFVFLLGFVQAGDEAFAARNEVQVPRARAACAERNRTARTRIVPPAIERRPSMPPASVKHESRAAAPSPSPVNPPVSVTTCDPGGCWDSGGNRYSGGAGNTYLDKNGRPCHGSGVTLQCF